MAFTVTNDPWKSQHSVLVGTETETARLSVSGVPDGNNYTLYLTDAVNNGLTIQHASGELRQIITGSADLVTNVGGSEKMRIDTDGNVGIARTNPVTTLEVGGSGIQINDGTGGTSPKLVFGTEPQSQNSAKAIFMEGYWMKYQGHENEGHIIQFTDDAENIQVGLKLTGNNNSDASEAHFYPAGGGKVGINTGSPDQPLTVKANGAVSYNGATDLDGESFMKFEGTSADGEAAMIRWANHGSMNNYFGVTQVGSSGQGDFVWTSYGGGSYAERMRIESTGDVGIATASPSYKLHVNGTFYSAGSSKDYKQEIKDYKPNTDAIMQLRPIHYEYKDDYKHFGKRLENDKWQIGLVAEEVAEIFPELAVMKEEDGKDVVRNVDYEKLTVVLLSELQNMKKEIEGLKKQAHTKCGDN